MILTNTIFIGSGISLRLVLIMGQSGDILGLVTVSTSGYQKIIMTYKTCEEQGGLTSKASLHGEDLVTGAEALLWIAHFSGEDQAHERR